MMNPTLNLSALSADYSPII